MVLNIFRILADGSHIASKFVLIWTIHSNKSAEGVSLITQVLYFAVFITRYLDLFWDPPTRSWYLFLVKNFYIWSSLYIIFVMTKVYARTREREKAWKLGALVSGGSIVFAPLVAWILDIYTFSFSSVLRVFSLILESLCVLPQLLLLRQTTVPTVLNSFYLVLLGTYRGWYILNWIYRHTKHERDDRVAIIFGIVQTALYVDFAWVYWTRQRVKLRRGGVVDSDDLRNGWLVKRVLGPRMDNSIDEEQAPAIHGEEGEDNTADTRPNNRWGARGVSVSADDTLHDHHSRTTKLPVSDGTDEERQGILLSDDEDAHDAAVIDPSSINNTVFNSGNAWGQPGRHE